MGLWLIECRVQVMTYKETLHLENPKGHIKKRCIWRIPLTVTWCVQLKNKTSPFDKNAEGYT